MRPEPIDRDTHSGLGLILNGDLSLGGTRFIPLRDACFLMFIQLDASLALLLL